MISYHVTLLWMNMGSIALLLLDLLVLIFHSESPRGQAKGILITTTSIAMLVRMSAIILVMVMLRSNGVG